MPAAADPGRLGLHERLHRPQVQGTPTAPAVPVIEARAAPPAGPAAPTTRCGRPNVHDNDARVVVELNAFHDSVLQPQQGTPYPCFLHAVLRSRFQVLDSPKSIARAACTYFTAGSKHPRVCQESHYLSP